MSSKYNEYSIIPNPKRPKLYKEMEVNPYGLSNLKLSRLFIYLDENNENINIAIHNKYHRVMKFQFYAEFLNVINFSLLFYKLNFNIVFEYKTGYAKIIFILLELSTLFFLISIFLIYNKNKKIISEIKFIMLFGIISIIISKYVSLIRSVGEWIHKYINYKSLTFQKNSLNEEKYYIKNFHDYLEPILNIININYFFFLSFFLLINNYLINSETTNIFSSFLIIILILIISIIHEQTFMKIRCLLIGINIFELIPKIRKFANTCSEKIVKITYFINSLICGIVFFYLNEFKFLIMISISNIIFIIFYPIVFNYFYHKEKLFMKGMWDVPELIKFN